MLTDTGKTELGGRASVSTIVMHIDNALVLVVLTAVRLLSAFSSR